ncbi:MAG: DUF1573 domain-containing protein [Porphyromonas sp.]|nr:DUF1573 domain-containing protein [Porphyromonas sp.]
MKKITTLMLSLLCMVAFTITEVSAQQTDNKKAKIEAPVLEHNFGTFKEGDGAVSHVFKIKNTGGAPLVITRVLSSCGCTTPSFSKEPIAPGKSGQITVTYDPAGRVYPFVKTISVYSNGKEGPLVLTIKGEVVK